ncbi:KEOPS complex subunit Cgi121 [Methanothermococcus sp. Ax23]|jgi:tRNA threonylcarbamoyladenosine modification (KEOPS) complex Cgi121 subunit|uniref:KEOPS complex subunit Cgi121 n=1 Tax=Methanothermococcus sp. Ax23 TaxID=3156486 RepID=UPI003B9E7070
MIIVGVRDAKIINDIFNLKLPFQILNADLIATKKHIIHAVNQAKSKKPITNSFWMEILVRASAQRQISNAIKIIGVKPDERKKSNICIVCEDEETLNKLLNTVGGEIDDSVLELTPSKMENIKRTYNIKGLDDNNEYNNEDDLVKRVCEKISIIEVM